MTNIVSDLIQAGMAAASSNHYVAAGLIGAGILIGVGTWAYRKWKK